MSQQQVREPRYAVALDCSFTVGNKPIKARTRNLSRGGVSVMVTDPLNLSTTVELSLVLVFGDNSYSEPLVIPALVVWCTRLGEQWQVGAKFSGVSREQKSFLDLFIHYLDGGGTAEEAAVLPTRRS